jgi:hypothetical protein
MARIGLIAELSPFALAATTVCAVADRSVLGVEAKVADPVVALSALGH